LQYEPTTGFSTCSLHDALPICIDRRQRYQVFVPIRERACIDDQHIVFCLAVGGEKAGEAPFVEPEENSAIELAAPVTDRHSRIIDRKSTRLNSSHQIISYAVFC